MRGSYSPNIPPVVALHNTSKENIQGKGLWVYFKGFRPTFELRKKNILYTFALSINYPSHMKCLDESVYEKVTSTSQRLNHLKYSALGLLGLGSHHTTNRKTW